MGASRGSAGEVLLAFLKLGLTSFGGPVAHLGYFRAEFVQRRAWLDDARYADLVALCQFLPGPTSSQVGFALGLQRAGWRGALCAWAGFTLPSALALILFAWGVTRWAGVARSGAIHGLEVVAVAVVAQAVWGMARSLCPDGPRAAIAVAAGLLVLAVPAVAGQLMAIGLGALAGRWWVRAPAAAAVMQGKGAPGRAAGAALLLMFAVLLVGLPLMASVVQSPVLDAVSAFYRSGALVFGGGHVVLPLLQASVVPSGLLSLDLFLAGYGAAQAVPGPLFTFAAYLGAALPAPLGGWGGGLLLLVTIFLPGCLLVTGVLPFWTSLRERAGVPAALAGVSAAVVGLLAAALVHPIGTSAVRSVGDALLALAAFALLTIARQSPWRVALLGAVGGWVLAR